MDIIFKTSFIILFFIIGWNLAEVMQGKPIKPRDYQIEVIKDKALIYDGNTLKGQIILFGQLDSLITKDNQ